MNNEHIYKLIRDEDVAIWAGAGFSLYAGFPSGYGLAQKIYGELSKGERKQIRKNLNLDELAGEFVDLKNGDKTQLNRILIEVFRKQPTTRQMHEMVVTIPHFKNIVTTNYDTLFESTYAATAASVCWKDEHIPYADSKRVTIYKVHGCITDLDSIVLTKKDYSTFFQKDYNTPFWSHLIGMLSTKTILFIGYGYEDPNIWQMFDKISAKIGQHRKEAYLVVPAIAAHKVAALARQKVTVIQQTAEEFLTGLHDNIKDNIFGDFHRNSVSVSTFASVLADHNLSASIDSSHNGFQLRAIAGVNGSVTGVVQFRFMQPTGSDFFYEVLEKDDTDQVILSAEQLEHFEMRVEGLKLPVSDNTLVSISFQNRPFKELTFDIGFPAKDFELTKLNAKLYKKKEKIKAVINYETSEFDLFISTNKLPYAEVELTHAFPQVFTNVTSALNTLKLYYYLITSEQFQVYIPESDFVITQKLPKVADERLSDKLAKLIEYFSLLKKIEIHFGKRFANIDKIRVKDMDIAHTILRSITRERYKIELSGEVTIDVKFNPGTRAKVRDLPATQGTINVVYKDFRAKLHGLEFYLGNKQLDFCVKDITNLADVLSGKTNKVRILTVDSALWESFVETGIPSSTETSDN